MSSSTLAEKQLPQWEIEDIASTSPSQKQPGPSDLLEQARPFRNVGGVSSMRAIQSPKPRVFISFAQGSVGVASRIEKIARLVADSPDISTSQRVTFKPASTSEWHRIPDFALNIRPTSEEATIWVTWSIEPSGRASFEPAAVTKSSPAENLQNRYKELSSKRYMDSLTSDERIEIKNIEEQLDELDTHDTDLKTFIDQLDQGYDKLRRGLKEINGILDELLRH